MRSLILLALLPACGSLVDAQADIQRACVTYPDVKVPAAHAHEMTIDKSFTVDDLADIQDLSQHIQNLEFVDAEAHATSGITEFDFVQAAHLSVSGSDLPALDVYDCDGDCVPSGDTLTVPSDARTSAVAYVQAGAVTVDVLLIGQAPTTAWTMDVDVCFRGQLEYETGL